MRGFSDNFKIILKAFLFGLNNPFDLGIFFR